MTTDNPRELRAAEDTARAALVPGSQLTHAANCAAWTLAKAWLATVRDDDGEEQPECEITQGLLTIRVARYDLTVVSIRHTDGVVLFSFPSVTRGQFRALCRGLGITPTAATPETPG